MVKDFIKFYIKNDIDEDRQEFYISVTLCLRLCNCVLVSAEKYELKSITMKNVANAIQDIPSSHVYKILLSKILSLLLFCTLNYVADINKVVCCAAR